MSVAIVVPHVPIPERQKSLGRALSSIASQTQQVDEIHIAIDVNHEGPGATRTRGLQAVQSEWTIYLDDDDWFEPNYVERVLQCAQGADAGVVYPWFSVNSGTDPFPMFFGKPWDNAEPHIFPVTYLVRTELALKAGGFPSRDQMGERWAAQWNGKEGGEDWFAILALMEVGAKIVHLPERLWWWEHGAHEHFSGRSW